MSNEQRRPSIADLIRSRQTNPTLQLEEEKRVEGERQELQLKARAEYEQKMARLAKMFEEIDERAGKVSAQMAEINAKILEGKGHLQIEIRSDVGGQGRLRLFPFAQGEFCGSITLSWGGEEHENRYGDEYWGNKIETFLSDREIIVSGHTININDPSLQNRVRDALVLGYENSYWHYTPHDGNY